MPELKLMVMLRRRRVSDVAVELECTVDDLDEVLAKRKINPQPEPADLPDHCTWTPESDPAFARIVADGIDEWSAGKAVDRAARWAVREGIWHVNAMGELIKDWNPELLAKPVEWSPVA